MVKCLLLVLTRSRKPLSTCTLSNLPVNSQKKGSPSFVSLLSLSFSFSLSFFGTSSPRFFRIAFHPGYVKTDMNSGGGGELETEEACQLA